MGKNPIQNYAPLPGTGQMIRKALSKKHRTVKFEDIPEPCMNPGHKPPSHRVFEPGVYEHTCPGCGKVTTFTVPKVTF